MILLSLEINLTSLPTEKLEALCAISCNYLRMYISETHFKGLIFHYYNKVFANVIGSGCSSGCMFKLCLWCLLATGQSVKSSLLQIIQPLSYK